jgi:hypothetical protein
MPRFPSIPGGRKRSSADAAWGRESSANPAVFQQIAMPAPPLQAIPAIAARRLSLIGASGNDEGACPHCLFE